MSFYRQRPTAAQRRGHYLVGARRDQATMPETPATVEERLGSLRQLSDADLRRAGERFMQHGDSAGVAAVQREHIRRRRDAGTGTTCEACGAVTFGIGDSCGRCGARHEVRGDFVRKEGQR